VRAGESFSGIVISLALGTAVFGLWFLFSGSVITFTPETWLGIGALSFAGVIHFLVGRYFAFNSIRTIGANRAIPVQTLFILVSALISTFVLGSAVTLSLGLALVLVTGGIITLNLKIDNRQEPVPLSRATLNRGFASSALTALCWGISPVLIKYGLNALGSVPAGTFISTLAALVVIALVSLKPSNSRTLRRLDPRALLFLSLAAAFIAGGQIFQFLALDAGDVTVVVPLIGSGAVWTYPLSYLINRKIESFNRLTVTGGLAVVFGVLLIFWKF
jgi:transporter family protein